MADEASELDDGSQGDGRYEALRERLGGAARELVVSVAAST